MLLGLSTEVTVRRSLLEDSSCAYKILPLPLKEYHHQLLYPLIHHIHNTQTLSEQLRFCIHIIHQHLIPTLHTKTSTAMATTNVSTSIGSTPASTVLTALHNHDLMIKTLCPALISYNFESGDPNSQATYSVTDKKPIGQVSYNPSSRHTYAHVYEQMLQQD
jgi:hypothetical protein